MNIEATPLRDCFIIYDTFFPDDRGYFFESFNRRTFKKTTGLEMNFVQDNQSKSVRGVLRGLHFQIGDSAQAKLVRVIEGSVYDVAVDLRRDSPTFGQSFGIELTGDNHKQLFIPRGFAHGFVVLSQTCTFFYKCDNYYNKSAESGIMYNDPELNIDWQIGEHELIISEKDMINPSFKQAQNLLI
jgi:dTDP-4-dehydrorhamnose 3,5-epimerase